jgi:hypothetical protein
MLFLKKLRIILMLLKISFLKILLMQRTDYKKHSKQKKRLEKKELEILMLLRKN